MVASIKLFWKENCIKCPAAKNVFNSLKKDGYSAQAIDIDTVDGLAEGAFYSVLSTPTLMAVDENEDEIVSWRGDIPPLKKIKDTLNDYKSQPAL